MLRRLLVSHFTLMDQVEVAFDRGLTMLSGETGAGKSMLLHALDIALGARASSEDVQQGASQAVVEAAFDVPDASVREWLGGKGYDAEEDLIIRRVISREGKSQAYVNGALAPVALLRDLGMWLADVHGQHEQQTLLKPATHVDALDAFGKLEGLRRTVEERYRLWHDLEGKRHALVMDAQERARRLDLLAFQKQELEAARFVPAEDETLAAERSVLRHADALVRQAAEAAEALVGEGQAAGLVERSARLAAAMAQQDGSLKGVADRFRQVAVELRDLSEEMRAYRDRVEANPPRLEEIEQRLALLERLKRKYGATIEDMAAYLDQVTASWNTLQHHEEAMGSLAREAEEAQAAFRREGEELSKRRRAASTRLSRLVEGELQALGMPHAKVAWAWQVLDQPAANGLEHVELLVSMNPGEAPRPLAKVASGGELSRLMLAFKVVLAKQDRVPTMIFDEVDAGVGGRVADVIGKKLKFISQDRQVVCVTHMAQIASFGDAHYHIVKRVADHRTTTLAVRLTDRRAVVEELAKMLSGEPLTPTALQHAEELVGRASTPMEKGHKAKR